MGNSMWHERFEDNHKQNAHVHIRILYTWIEKGLENDF